MKGKRLWQTLRMYSILEPVKRTEYLRKNNIFASLGENCSIEDRIIPLYAKCIRIGNNVRLASHVLLITHDVSYFVLNNLGLETNAGKRFKEKIGCIDIGNNVFVGSNSTILYDVKIGNNVITYNNGVDKFFFIDRFLRNIFFVLFGTAGKQEKK